MELVTIAKIVRTRGLRGEAVADLLTDFPERFDGLKTVVARSADGGVKKLELEGFWFQKNRVILKFAGFDTVEKAEELRGTDICIAESESVELDEGEFFDWQLEGCRVETLDGIELGEVRELMRTGGTEVLIVAGGEKEYMIPFAEAICTEVDIENKRIVIDPPEGLLDF